MDHHKYNKIELLALIKNYNKVHNDKIKNADKMKKDELKMICDKYNIVDKNDQTNIEIDLNNVCKRDLQKDVQVHFIQTKRVVPDHVMQMKKKVLIDFMSENGIRHMSKEVIQQILANHEKLQNNKLIIVNNIIKYDNIDVSTIDDATLESYIVQNELDTNIEHLQDYAVLLHDLYTVYDKFCTKIRIENYKDKIRSFPKILNKIQNAL